MTENRAAPVPVCIDFNKLCDHSTDLGDLIEEAFGENSLGLVTIKNVPNYTILWQALLPLAASLAQLPPDVKLSLEDPLSSFNFGWSQGKEKLENGSFDSNKGSFYANPLVDRPTEDPTLLEQQPAYCRPNIWPTEQLPELEEAFKALGKVIYDVGMLVTEHCSKYLVDIGISMESPLPKVLQKSNCHKGRLLCYLPPHNADNGSAAANGAAVISTDIAMGPEYAAGAETSQQQQWCGWHTDHGSITGLTSAMYTDAQGNEVACADPQAGLYIRNRLGEMVQIVIPPDQIAYQLGEVFQILSGGILQATPHCVVAPRSRPQPHLQEENHQQQQDHQQQQNRQQQQVYRNTFALFMQPRWDEILQCPDGFDPGQVGIDVWKDGMSFGEFSKRRFADYY